MIYQHCEHEIDLETFEQFRKTITGGWSFYVKCCGKEVCKEARHNTMREEEAARAQPPTRAQRRKFAKMKTAGGDDAGDAAGTLEDKGEEPEKPFEKEENPAKKAKKRKAKD